MQKGVKTLIYLILSISIVFHFLIATANASDIKINFRKISESGSAPFWSPDGKEILYIDKDGLFVISSSGSGEKRKILSGRLREPRWSPDGRYISYVDRKGLKIISPDASGQPKLIYPDNNVQMPVWSPDSKWLAFYLSELPGTEGSGVFAVNIETLKSKQLSYRGINPYWSGDSKSLIYFIYTDKSQGLGQMISIDLEGTVSKELNFIGGLCMHFTPLRNLLVFAPNRKDGTSIGVYLASPFKDDKPVKLSDDGFFPNFSFDGEWVSFFKPDPETANNMKIYIIRPTGDDLMEVAEGIYPKWAFNKKALVYEMLGVRGGIYVAEIYEN